MRTDFQEDIDVLSFRNWRPVWSDFERSRYLRKLISATKTRLEDLRRETPQDSKGVVFEETVLSAAEKELRILEHKLFVGEKG